MNRKQKIVLWIGIVVFVLMLLCPPATHTYEPYGDLRPIKVRRIDYAGLFARWLTVTVVTGGLIITFRDKKSKDDQKQ